MPESERDHIASQLCGIAFSRIGKIPACGPRQVASRQRANLPENRTNPIVENSFARQAAISLAWIAS